jgi:hypothetical protein
MPMPAAARACGPAASVRLPKRSMPSTQVSILPRSVVVTGIGTRTSDSTSAGEPSEARPTPLASRAQAGANTSRPWKVAAAPGRARAEAVDREHEEAVVGADEHAAVLTGDRKGPASRPDPRVDDREMRAHGTDGDKLRKEQASPEDVAGRDVVRQVDPVGRRTPGDDDRVQRTHVLRPRSVVGQQCDDRPHRFEGC